MKQTLIKMIKMMTLGLLFLSVSQVALAEETNSNETESTVEATITEEKTEEDEQATEDSTEMDSETENKPTETSDSNYDFTTTEGIRKSIVSGSAGEITEEELAKFSDDQINNTMILFERYNLDYVGLDLGALYRVFKNVYIDQQLSWEAIEPQLSFTPHKFTSFKEMKSHVKEIQNYLAALYPEGSIFGAKKVSDEIVLASLEQLETFEEELGKDNTTLPAGRMYLLIEKNNQALAAPTTDSSAKEDKATETSSSAKPVEKEGGKIRLPQTGEELVSWLVPIFGIALLVGAGVVYYKKKKAN